MVEGLSWEKVTTLQAKSSGFNGAEEEYCSFCQNSFLQIFTCNLVLVIEPTVTYTAQSWHQKLPLNLLVMKWCNDQRPADSLKPNSQMWRRENTSYGHHQPSCGGLALWAQIHSVWFPRYVELSELCGMVCCWPWVSYCQLYSSPLHQLVLHIFLLFNSRLSVWNIQTSTLDLSLFLSIFSALRTSALSVRRIQVISGTLSAKPFSASEA